MYRQSGGGTERLDAGHDLGCWVYVSWSGEATATGTGCGGDQERGESSQHITDKALDIQNNSKTRTLCIPLHF